MSTKKAKKEKTAPKPVDRTLLLANWQTLNDKISELDEQEALTLLEIEKKNKRRPGFLLRLYGRYNTMRTKRERNELLGE